MKKILLLLTILSVAVNAAAFDIRAITTHAAVEIAASGSSTSAMIDLESYKPLGYFSLQVTVTGNGTVKGEYLVSNDGTNYVEPASGNDIFSGMTKTGGPGSDGKNIYTVSPILGRYLKIKITETGGANTATVSAVLAIQ